MYAPTMGDAMSGDPMNAVSQHALGGPDVLKVVSL